MKASPNKYGSPGKVGKAPSKPGKPVLSIVKPMGKIDKVTVGSAQGILNKHFK